MSKRLEMLIEKHRRKNERNIGSVGNRHVKELIGTQRHYSVSLKEIEEKAQKIEEIEDEFLNLDVDINEAINNDSEQEVKIQTEKAALILRDSKNKFLSRLFSGTSEVTCSRILARKLINYYLRNRRKHRKLLRGYSQQLPYNNSLDGMLHNVYMELGRTLYFSFLGKVRDVIKNAIFNFLEAAGDLIIGIVGGALLSLSYYAAFKNATATFVKFLIKLLAITTPAGKLLAAVVLGILSGLAMFFVLRGLGQLVIGEDEEALKIYNKGREIYKKIKRALRKGLPKILGTKGIIALALRVNKDGINKQKVEDIVKSLESIGKEVDEFISHDMDPDFPEIVKESEKVRVSVRALVREDLKVAVENKSGQKIVMPDVIELKPFDVSINNEQATTQTDDNHGIPPEIMAIALFTSPEINIEIVAKGSKLRINFLANKYFARYARFKENEIRDFLISYLKAYDKNEVMNRLRELAQNLGNSISSN